MKMCQVLKVSRSSYYEWLKRPESKRKKDDQLILSNIKRIHQESFEIYAIRRITD